MPAASALPDPAVPSTGRDVFRRLFITALAAALPVAALFAWSLHLSALDLQRQGTASVLAQSAETARRVEATLARLDVVADVLLARPEIAGMDAGRCAGALRDLPRVDPLILNVGLFDLDGRPLCVARPLPAMPAGFRQSAWFRELLAQDRRALTRPYFSPATRRQVLSMGSPVRDPDGRRIGILGVSVDLELLSASLQAGPLPDGAAVAVVAADGLLIARNLDPARWIGTLAPMASLAAVPDAAASGAFQAAGVDGTPRTIGFAPVGREGWRVFTGVPTAHFEQAMQASRRHGLAVLAVALLLGVAASWIGVGQLSAEFEQMLRSLVRSRHVERAASVRFLQLFSVIPVGAAVVDGASARLLEANDTFCRDLSLPRDQVLGRTLRALGLAPTDAAVTEAHARQLRSEGHVRGLEAVLRDAAGTERTVLLSVEPIAWQGAPAWLCVQVDITQRRQAERLQAANAAKTAFLSRMSHELRTPLHAIVGIAQLLQQALDGRLQPDERQQLGLLRQAGGQLQALIDDVLDVSRIEAGQLPLDLQPLDLAAAVDEVLQLSAGAAREAGVALARAPDAGAWVRSDATRLRQVLLNLLSNAIKYNRPGGRVVVGMAAQGDRVALQVQDDGLGMTAAQQQGLFQPFNRLGRERSGVPGTGIGLLLSRDLVALMGGTLAVVSDPARGTTVRVLLPAATPPAAPAPPTAAVQAPAPDTTASAPGPCGEVLYIEDNPVNALIVEQVLAAWPGVRLTVAPDGGSGLRLAATLRPRLVLLDLQLPDMDGLQVLRCLRADPATQATPVVVLSASAMPEVVAAARAAGADGFWPKPFDFQDFLNGLRRHLPPV